MKVRKASAGGGWQKDLDLNQLLGVGHGDALDGAEAGILQEFEGVSKVMRANMAGKCVQLFESPAIRPLAH